MIEIKNFLSKETCDYCINFFNINQSKTENFKQRKKIHILSVLNLDKKITELVDKYSQIYPNHYIKNFEILKWPVGDSHDWHDDTIYYDKTTITYLNEGYEGGRTTVDNYDVEPKIGKIILFDAHIKHKVSSLIKGDRYVMLVWYNKIIVNEK